MTLYGYCVRLIGKYDNIIPVAIPSSADTERDNGSGVSCLVMNEDNGSGVGEAGGGGAVSAAFSFLGEGGASPKEIVLRPPGGLESRVVGRVTFISVLVAVDIYDG